MTGLRCLLRLRWLTDALIWMQHPSQAISSFNSSLHAGWGR